MLARLALAGVLTAVLAGAVFAQADKRQSGVGYPTVAAALEAVKAKPGVRVPVQDGWTVMEDRAAMTMWSFTPAGHPAHPTVARREVKQAKDGSISIQQSVLCQAQKPACGKVNAELVELKQGAPRD